MKSYLVGGAVRDRLLGLPVHERDWVVVGATEQEMLEAGFKRADADFPVFLHPETGDEYALARIERKTGPGYKGFVVEAGPDISLQQDLARRDLTVNALAEDEAGGLTDYFHGQDDLERRVLRHITPAFEEDPVRILRVARFAARFGALGFSIAPETLCLMARMAASEDLNALRPERVWQEMLKALGAKQPGLFFETLHACGALAALIPALAAALGSHSPSAQSAPLAALAHAVSISDDPRVRFTAVMYGAVNGESVADLCGRLRVERGFSELLERVVRLGPTFSRLSELDAEGVLELLEQTGAFQQMDRFRRFLDACSALWPQVSAGNCERLQQAQVIAKGIDAKALLAAGFGGPALGAELKRRRIEAIRMHEARE